MGKSTCLPTSFWLKNELRFLKCTVDRRKDIAQSTCVKYIKLIVLFYIAIYWPLSMLFCSDYKAF